MKIRLGAPTILRDPRVAALRSNATIPAVEIQGVGVEAARPAVIITLPRRPLMMLLLTLVVFPRRALPRARRRAVPAERLGVGP